MKNTDWYKWFNDKNLTKFTKQGYFPNTYSNQKKYFMENILTKKRVQLGVINKKKNKLIGMLALYNIEYSDRCCFISSIFSKSHKNMNSLIFFKEAQSLMIDHAFDKLNMRRIEAAANEKNLLIINQKLFGFQLEGTLKERDFIEGKYTDRHILRLFKKEWKNFKNKKI